MQNSNKNPVYPYMPNTLPEVRQEMLDRVGIDSVDELFAHIPEEIRFGDKPLPLPERMASEQTLSRYITGILKKNKTCDDYISFLGGGVAQHYIPAVCDAMVQKGEFLTTFMGHYCVDSGKYQVWWEFQSLICPLVARTKALCFTMETLPVGASRDAHMRYSHRSRTSLTVC